MTKTDLADFENIIADLKEISKSWGALTEVYDKWEQPMCQALDGLDASVSGLKKEFKKGFANTDKKLMEIKGLLKKHKKAATC